MSRRSRRRRGFTLVEAMVSLTLLVVVMIVALTLLFTMRSFAERVQIVIEPRQTARRAVDYLSHFLQGATDVGIGAQNAIVTYYNSDASNPASRVQATYDNLTGSETGNSILSAGLTAFGDAGTDVISILLPTGPPGKYPLYPNWLGYSPPTRDYYVGFKGGCGVGYDDAANMTAFKAVTGENGTGHSNAMLLLQDNQGLWQYFRIKAYVDANPATDGCAVTNGWNVHIQTEPGTAPPSAGGDGPLDPPGGHPGTMNDPVYLVTGLEAFSFRVMTVNNVPTLQQKPGLFDPTSDNPGTAFVPIIENIEDLQVSWLYSDGTFWQTANATYDLKNYTAPAPGPTPTPGGSGPGPTPIPADCNNQCIDDVPWQAGPTAPAPARDITQVMGLRFSVVARSRPVTFGARQMSNSLLRFRPAVENRTTPGTPDDFEHFRATVTVMLKNRMLGS